MKKIFFLLSIFILFATLQAQEINITNALKEIENGNLISAETQLKKFKTKNPNDPSVVFLDAVMTKNANEAIKKFSFHYQNFPNSKYADASLFRIFSYYYALGYYKKAESYLSELKKNFPNSPYLKTADKTIPDVDDFELSKTQTKIENQKPSISKEDFVEGKFTIQVGAFLNPENAVKLSEQLKAEGLTTEISSKVIGGSTLKVVTAGIFPTEDEAKIKLEFINQKFNLKGRVILISNQNDTN